MSLIEKWLFSYVQHLIYLLLKSENGFACITDKKMHGKKFKMGANSELCQAKKPERGYFNSDFRP